MALNLKIMKWPLSFAQHLNLQNGLTAGLMWALHEILHRRIIYVQVITLPSPLDLFKERCWRLNLLSLLFRVGLGLLWQVQGSVFSTSAMWGGSRSCGTGKASWPDTTFAGSLIFCCPASRTVSNRLPFHISDLQHFITTPTDHDTYLNQLVMRAGCVVGIAISMSVWLSWW